VLQPDPRHLPAPAARHVPINPLALEDPEIWEAFSHSPETLLRAMCHALGEEMDVARYYFDIRHGTDILRDDEGAEFDSLDAAIRGVARSAAEIGTGRLARGDLSDVVVEIRDEHDQRVITVTASMKVDRHDLSSPPSDLG
jgi:Domain of unknown function (DUF6894)